MVMGSSPTGDAVTGLHGRGTLQHNWHASASVTLAARGLKGGLNKPLFVQHFTLHKTLYHAATLWIEHLI